MRKERLKTALVVTLLLALGHYLAAACATGTIAYWPMTADANDVCGTYNKTVVGSLGFTTIAGFACAGPFSDANYTKDDSSGLLPVISGATTYTMEGYGYAIAGALASNPVILDGTNIFIQCRSNGVVRFNCNGVVYDTPAGAITEGAWFDLGISSTSSPARTVIYINNVLQNDTATSNAIPTLTKLWNGRSSAVGGFSFNGYVRGWRLSGVFKTSFPTVDTSSDPDQRRRRN